MKHTTYFKQMMNDFQAINLLEKGISFTEEGFTQLYEQSMAAISIEEETVDNVLDDYIYGVMDGFREYHDNGVHRATIKGIAMGAVAAGVGIGLGKIGSTIINKRRKLEDKEKWEEYLGKHIEKIKKETQED